VDALETHVGMDDGQERKHAMIITRNQEMDAALAVRLKLGGLAQVGQEKAEILENGILK